MLFFSLTKGITLKICRLCVCVIADKCSFEPFICLDFVALVKCDVLTLAFEIQHDIKMTVIIIYHFTWFLCVGFKNTHGSLYCPQIKSCSFYILFIHYIVIMVIQVTTPFFGFLSQRSIRKGWLDQCCTFSLCLARELTFLAFSRFSHVVFLFRLSL